MLVSMYAKCGNLEKVKSLFDEIKERDVIAWSAMISVFVQADRPKDALYVYQEMQIAGLKPNQVTIVNLLPACADLSEVKLGKSIHSHALKHNIHLDVLVGTALVSMYAQCGSFTSALSYLDDMEDEDIVTWNALINGYAQLGEAVKTLELFNQLRMLGQRPDPGTMIGAFPACALLDALELGTCLHGLVIKFCENVISWNTMFAGYMHNGLASEALSAFRMMRAENMKPNLVSLICILPAAAFLAAIREGSALHSCIIKTGFVTQVHVEGSIMLKFLYR